MDAPFYPIRGFSFLGLACTMKALEDVVGEGEGVARKKLCGGESPGSGGGLVEVDALRKLLSEQSAMILESQRIAVEAAVGVLEKKQSERFDLMDKRMADHGSKLEQMDVSQQDLLHRVKALEQGGRFDNASGNDGRSLVSKYACTLVFGGWARDTRRQMLLSQLDAALAFLSLDELLDERPWTTGPRRSTAMVKFKFREGEGHQEMRQRMLKLVTTFAEVDYKVAGNRLWCTFSKTPEERARAGHASLVKRVVQAVAPVCLNALTLNIVLDLRG